MKLVTYCKLCSEKNTIDSNGILLRRDLEEKYGNSISFQCKQCLQHYKVHPNQVFATTSRLPMFICSVLGLSFIVWGILLKNSLGFYTIWTLVIGGVILIAGFLSTGNSTAKAFNKLFV